MNDVAERNIISGNAESGVRFAEDHGVIAGNYIGTDATGMQAVSNGNGFGVHGGGVDSTIVDNLISGNGAGLWISGSNLQVQGNRIGTDVTGDAALGNDLGIYVEGTNAPVHIGGTTPEIAIQPSRRGLMK